MLKTPSFLPLKQRSGILQDRIHKIVTMASCQSATGSERVEAAIHYGHDDASDIKDGTASILSPLTSSMDVLTLETPNKKNSIQPCKATVPIPRNSTGLVTFAYKRALLNRVKEHKLQAGGRYDLSRYTPILFHDTLMLPGSLANLIGKVLSQTPLNCTTSVLMLAQGSPEDILNRMTPALLPGHHVHVDSENGSKPVLVSSPYPDSYVQGMILFGQGKRARGLVHRHYRPQHTKRKKVAVEIEVVVLKPMACRRHEFDFWEPQRRTIYAHVWKRCRGGTEGCGAGEGNSRCPDWTLEEYLAGLLTPDLPMRIEANAKGDEREDGYLGRDVAEHDIEVEKREVVYGGPGRLYYERIKGDGRLGW